MKPLSRLRLVIGPCAVGRHRAAFTLTELLVVLAVLICLGALVVPGMARTRADGWSAVCRNQMRQLGLGIRLFQQDRNDMFPPGAVHAPNAQYSWDSFVHPYIGGRAPASDLSTGVLWIEKTPPVLRCPADLQPKEDWMGNWFGVRSYAMVGVGSTWSKHFHVDPKNGTYPLPKIELGVGIYWFGYSSDFSGWEARSYKGSVVKDPGQTLLLVEQPCKLGPAGGEYPAVSLGITRPGPYTELFQIDPGALADSVKYINQGIFTYLLHGSRFNYLFHDGHVANLATNQTIGTGSLSNPKGMWTVEVDD